MWYPPPAADQCGRCDPDAVFLLRLPAQHIDKGARGQRSVGRDRLPLHGKLDEPQHHIADPDGRRRRVNWVARSRSLTATSHIFQNLGEGTYYHSGSLAVRQAIAANTNITFKILFNDAVAMTGGQIVDGPISASQAIAAIRSIAEGAKKVVVVSDDQPSVFKPSDFPARRAHVSDRRETWIACSGNCGRSPAQQC